MNTNLALLLLLAPYSFYLMFSSEKHRKSASGIIGTLAVFTFVCSICLFFLQIISIKQSNSLFDWIQISNFKVDFGFLLDQLSILWCFCNRNWFVNSYVLYQLCMMTRICISILLI
jgi:NADH-quinone oxidoreductase subunit L